MDKDYATKAQAGMIAGAGLGQLAAQQNYTAANAMPAPIQSMSDGIISRLNYIRSNFSEMRASLNAVADKIVGYAPTPIQANSTGQIKGEKPPASCFLDALSQVLSDIETIDAEVREHLNRLHRAF